MGSEIKENDFVPVDSRAKEEEKTFSAKAKITRQKERGLHIAFLVLVWTGVSLFVVVLVAKVCQMALPADYCWLDEAHTKKLDDFLTSGVIGGAITGFFKSKLNPSEKDK